MATAFEILFLMALSVPPVVLVLTLLTVALVPRRRAARRVSHAQVA